MQHDVIARETAHYQEHKRYILHFLERDRTECGRRLIRHILATWDRHLAFLDPAWVRGKRVIEVGCGNPRIVQYCKHLGATRAIGNDLSPAFVARGLRRPHNYAYDAVFPARHDDIELLYGDFNGPATKGLEVDTVMCFQSLHHIDLDAFVATCNRILTPGGRVVISDPVGDHPLRRIGNWVGRLSGLLSPDEAALTPGRVAAAFGERGFIETQRHSLNPTLEIFFHLTELLEPLSGALAFWLKAPLALLRPLEDRLERTLLQRRPRLGWRFFLVMHKPGGNYA